MAFAVRRCRVTGRATVPAQYSECASAASPFARFRVRTCSICDLFQLCLGDRCRERYDQQQSLAAGGIWQRAHLLATSRGLAARPANETVEMVAHDKEPWETAALRRSAGGADRESRLATGFRLLHGSWRAPRTGESSTSAPGGHSRTRTRRRFLRRFTSRGRDISRRSPPLPIFRTAITARVTRPLIGCARPKRANSRRLPVIMHFHRIR